jgi:hypothetical protein
MERVALLCTNHPTGRLVGSMAAGPMISYQHLELQACLIICPHLYVAGATRTQGIRPPVAVPPVFLWERAGLFV